MYKDGRNADRGSEVDIAELVAEKCASSIKDDAINRGERSV